MLANLLPPEHVFCVRFAGQAAVMQDLAARAAKLLGRSPAELATPLAAREALGTTGIGDGIAIPHARLSGLGRPLALFARLDRPVDWRAIDGQKVDLVFLLLSPETDPGLHLQALAGVTRRLRDGEVARGLRAAPDAAELRRRLLAL